ncbi:hypothetical protein SLEP1_g9723 [Rubroshorea leprosula]|uniref:Uncharacterized protein n=1 Tax=Rubroshorea leprosula TaxID=152421 RepID=A0AAV5IFP9_9ROSI|nr:hypothetical protein SLEP1_g9723 [Rubroshorea leprosula]
MYISLLCWTQVMISRAQLTTKQHILDAHNSSSYLPDAFYILFTCSKKTLGECKGRTVA